MSGPERARIRAVVFFDVDNTLLDNDRVAADLKDYLTREVGPARQKRYWAICEALRVELGYADYLGALQRHRAEKPHDPHLLAASSVLVSQVFQPRKIERSGLFEAVAGRVLIYIHKERELDDIARRYPADHYVLIDDKTRSLTAVKQAWGERLTTVLPRQGYYAHAADVASYPAADVTIERIGELTKYDLRALIATAQGRKES